MRYKKILIYGSGYVGFSLAVLFAEKCVVTIFDTDKNKIKNIKNVKSPIEEDMLQMRFEKNVNNIHATSDKNEINLHSFDLIFLALPTNYDPETNNFDTSIIDNVLHSLEKSAIDIPIIIKSTIPIGYTKTVSERYSHLKIIFSPEFLREGSSLKDNIYPSRIIVGEKSDTGNNIAEFIKDFSENAPEVILMDSSEAESVKLFANSYLAMRVSFFNELDSFCMENNLDSMSVIEGISSDSRINRGYNNPSFGYGGYCLPKDTKQLLSDYKSIPQSLFKAIVDSNSKRKKFIADRIIKKSPSTVGVYRLVMKVGSNNFRESAIFDVANTVKNSGIKIVVYEPYLNQKNSPFKVCNDISEFKEISDLIIANRVDEMLIDVNDKVFTRDLFGEN